MTHPVTISTHPPSPTITIAAIIHLHPQFKLFCFNCSTRPPAFKSNFSQQPWFSTNRARFGQLLTELDWPDSTWRHDTTRDALRTIKTKSNIRTKQNGPLTGFVLFKI